MTDPVEVTNLAGGVATRQQILAAGCTGYDITRAVRLGFLRRVRQARYVTERATLNAIVAARVGGQLAGPSAADSYGLWSGLDPRLHLSVGANSARLRTAVQPSLLLPGQELEGDLIRRRIRLHWIEDGAVPETGRECWRVPVAVCLRQVVDWCDTETAVACLDTALTLLPVCRDELIESFRDASSRAQGVVRRSRAGSDSGTESLVRQRLAGIGVRVSQQVWVAGVGRVDMVVVGSRVVVEVDSSFHDSPEARVEDARRDAELVAQGYVVVRLPYERIISDWAWCERTILSAVLAG